MRFMRQLLCFAVALWLSVALRAASAPELQEGDIVFQSSPHSKLTDMIEGATGSPYSHCGIIHRSGDRWIVIEAVGPVKETPWHSWIERGRGRHYSVFRMKGAYRTRIPAFIKAAQGYEGLPYDMHFQMDDRAIYCSELVFKAFHQATGEDLGKLQSVRELKWQPYVEYIKKIEGGEVPLDRKMITPRGLSEAPQIEKVHQE